MSASSTSGSYLSSASTASRMSLVVPISLCLSGVLASYGELVADLEDAACHPGGADHRVVLGAGADVAAQRDRVAGDVHRDVAVVGDQRVAVQGVLHQHGDVGLV